MANRLVIYVAGPYSGDTPKEVEANVKKAALVGQEIMRKGHTPICLHTMYHGWEIDTGLEYDMFMLCALRIEGKCNAICMVEGWEDSAGAKDELEAAEAWDMLVFYGTENIPA
jgi:hypothetical protein